VQALPFKSTTYRNYLPLFPSAIESMTFDEYDLVLSSSHCVAKGARARPDALHICYCHTPMRYVWDMYDEYFGKGRAGLPTRAAMSMVRPYLRRWDVRTSDRVSRYIANSRFVAERIRRIYNRSAEVIHPPVETSRFQVSEKDEGYFLVVGALVPYKKVDLAVRAFAQLGETLLVVGTGPEEDRLKAPHSGAAKNVEFLGWQNDEEVAALYAGCRALVFPGVEDFGIVPVEAMASGKPVIAFGKGGVLDTVVEGKTGVFFREQSVDSLSAVVRSFRPEMFDPHAIRAHAEQFDRKVFVQRVEEFLRDAIAAHQVSLF
jgi:glycosyltransferase involved in cell wall biosynthesis